MEAYLLDIVFWCPEVEIHSFQEIVMNSSRRHLVDGRLGDE